MSISVELHQQPAKIEPGWTYKVELDASCFHISRKMAGSSRSQDMWCYNFHGVVLPEDGSERVLVYPLYLTPDDWALLEAGVVLPAWQNI